MTLPIKRNTTTRDKHRATIRRSQPACGICGEPIDYTLPHLDPGAFVVDHVVPVVLGGSDTLANKQAAHRSCNRSKGKHTDGGPIIKHSASPLVRP